LKLKYPDPVHPKLDLTLIGAAQIKRRSRPNNLLAALDKLCDQGMEYILESDRIRIVPRSEAEKFWRDWLKSTEKP